jgi:acyl carrier protein
VLRTFLSEQLPDYMLPAAFVFLDTFPLTSSGKIDQRALPAPDQTTAEPHRYVAPRTDVEALLAESWAEVLGIAQVSTHDNFFALGGHSLLATQVIARIYDTFQVELQLRLLFEHPTIMELAVLIEELLVQEIENLAEDEVEDLVSGVID